MRFFISALLFSKLEYFNYCRDWAAAVNTEQWSTLNIKTDEMIRKSLSIVGRCFYSETYTGYPGTSKMESFAIVRVSPGYASIISRTFSDQKVTVFECRLKLFRICSSNFRI